MVGRAFEGLCGLANQAECLLNGRAASRMKLCRDALKADIEHRGWNAQLLTFVPRQRRPIDAQSPRKCGLGLLPPGGDEEFALG